MYRKKLIKFIYHPAKVGGHKDRGRGDIIALFCHVISRDYVIKASFDFMGGRPSRQVTIVLSLIVIVIMVVEI